ncbi:rna polymerase i-specific transcription-initiation factor rrn6 [Fusarium beomiforme]|uniref:Rna polymerase i-specific transcription-initiation factor rrn6 n=1 Tax=Fusarium beomiforme TaxID=44412 RepID=A0A9P5ACL2_9HYPO|nr:rna polymerase i-specific transcription-initiation factor rrn6 [Fusarium beomiforme]
MAETRRLTDLIHGHIGSLTYIPSENAPVKPGTFHSSRVTAEAPHFKVVGSSAELYPPSKTPAPEISSNLWQERRVQKRWLLQAHPEAFLGNSALSELLEESMNRYSKIEGEVSDQPLLAIGQMTNMSDHWRIDGSPMLAAATGESGELLRLAQIDQSKWKWGHDKHATLQPSVIDPDDPDEETIWASDSLPISQVKFATSLTRYDAIRWLIVQKQTSTTILHPEYHKVPVAQSSASNLNVHQSRLSRIDPNPILTISHKATGGNAQVDIAFNPNAKNLSPQIAIVDECGYWSIWDIVGARLKARVSLYACGHISDGLLKELPSITKHPAEKHGVLFVGTAKVDSFWEDGSQSADDSGGSVQRSSHLLIWNREKYEVIDLTSHIAVPPLSLLARPKSKPDAILDIRVSPANQNHIFVLTMRTIYWIDLFAKNKQGGGGPKPAILISCPRLLDREGLRMVTCLASEGGQEAAMVFVFSQTHKQLQTYWFGRSTENGLPYWHRDTLTLPQNSEATSGDIQSLEIHPVKLTLNKDTASGPGADYYRAGVQFYQGSILSKNLGVQYCICVSVKEHSMQITLPTGRVDRHKADQAQRWKRKRKQFIRHMGNAFVLPEGMADDNINIVVKSNARTNGLDKPNTRASAVLGPIRLNLDGFCRSLRQNLRAISDCLHDIPPALLSAIQERITKGVAEGRLPLKTWKEIGDELGPIDLRNGFHETQPDMLDLFAGDDGQAVVTQLGRQTSQEWIRELVSLSHLNQTYVDLWLDPLEGRIPQQEEEIRRGWIAGLAKDMFLATAGVMVQDMPLLGPASQEEDGRTQPTQSSVIRVKSSQSSNGGIPSSPLNAMPNSSNDAAIRRLQLLAPSLRSDKVESAKQSNVLSYWPTERGISPDDYLSSVAIASDRKFDEARLRLQRIENKRKAQNDKYKLPPFKKTSVQTTTGMNPMSSPMRPQREEPNTLPPMPAAPTPAQIMSSQQGIPSSSQSQGLFGPSFAMSQPVSGIFGDRKKAKKNKRKNQPYIMSHCHDEHSGHGHDHDHEHDHSDITPAVQFSLYSQINFDHIVTLNEAQRDAGQKIVKKTWQERLSVEPELESDVDEQLLMTVPFTAQIKLHSILIRTSPSASAPKTLHLFINRDDLDFAAAEESDPVQTLELSQTSDLQEIPVKRALFGKVQRLVLFFADNFGDGDEDVTRVSYLGFKGEWTQLGRAPANIIYEAAANPGDHKLKGTSVNQMGSGIGGRGPGV